MRTLATSEAGLVELAGDDPRWIWAFTCPTPAAAVGGALLRHRPCGPGKKYESCCATT